VIFDLRRYSPLFTINFNNRYNYVNLFNFNKNKIKETYNKYLKNFYFMFFKLNLNNKIYKFNTKKLPRLFVYGIHESKIRRDIFPIRFYKNKLKLNFFFNIAYLYLMFERNKMKYFNKYNKYDQLQIARIFCSDLKVNKAVRKPRFYLQDDFTIIESLEHPDYNEYMTVIGLYNLYSIFQMKSKYKKNVNYYFNKMSNKIYFFKEN